MKAHAIDGADLGTRLARAYNDAPEELERAANLPGIRGVYMKYLVKLRPADREKILQGNAARLHRLR